MLAVFLVILGSLGLILNWPIINRGILSWLTLPLPFYHPDTSPEQGFPAFFRPDGIIILVLSAVVLISAFVRTNRTLLNLRLTILAVIAAIISAEIFMAANLNRLLSSYTGTLYSIIFYFMAFVASIFRFGSLKSLNSTFIGKPMSESRVLSQNFVQLIENVSTVVKVTFTAKDKIGGGWNPGEEREFEANEIRIGRDAQWANLKVGEEWPSISNRHGIIRVIGQTIVYESLTDYYSFSVDGIPFKDPKELPDRSVLSLVSGHGPHLKVHYQLANRSWFHPQTVDRVREITSDEFKKLQLTFKIILIMVILALPLLLIFSGLQEKSSRDSSKQKEKITGELSQKVKETQKKLIEEEKKTHKLQSACQEDQIKITQLAGEKKQLEKEKLQKEKELAEKESQLEILKHPPLSEENKIELQRAANRIDLLFCSQDTAVYFPFVTQFENKKYRVGTGFFARGQDGKYYLITFKNLVYDPRQGKWGDTYFFIYKNTWEQFSNCLQTIKTEQSQRQEARKRRAAFTDLYHVFAVTQDRWKTKKMAVRTNGVIMIEMENFWEYLKKDTPVIEQRFSVSDKIAFFGCNENDRFYSVGVIKAIDPSFISIQAAQRNGLPGGPLVKVINEDQYRVIGMYRSKDRFIRF
jgi:hypothetical protein